MAIEFLTNEDRAAINRGIAQVEAKADAIEAELDAKADKTAVSSPYNYKGTATVPTLPTSDNAVNDTYYCTDVKCKYTWNGSAWYQSSLNETAYEEALGELTRKTSDGNLPASSLENRKKTFNVCDKHSAYIMPGAVQSSLNVVNNANYALVCIPIPKKATNYYMYTADSVEDLSMGTPKLCANEGLPQYGTAVAKAGLIPKIKPNLNGYISVTDSYDYIVLMLHFPAVSGTTAEKTAEVMRYAKMVLDSLVIRETEETIYDNINFGDMPYKEAYILDVEEENLPDETREKINKPEVTRKDEIKLCVGENIISDRTTVRLGDGWTGSRAAGYTHAKNYTEPLEIAIDSADGDIFFVEWDLDYSGYKSNSSTRVAAGTSYAQDTYFGKDYVEMLVKSEGGGSLFIYPLTTFEGTISNVRCRKVQDTGDEISQELYNILMNDSNQQLYGRWNVILSDNALENTVNSTRSVAIGHSALHSCKGGNRNIAVGTFSMSGVETGDRNISIGSDAMLSVKAAEDMVAIGFGAAYYGANLKKNVIVGAHAMQGAQDSTASGNVIVGYQAGYRNKANENTFLGLYAGYKHETGARNVGVGYWALHGNINGEDNTAVGAQAEVTDGVNGSTAIGNKAKATKSNQVVIGGDTVTETLVHGDLLVRGTDNVLRRIVFNVDGTCSWSPVK